MLPKKIDFVSRIKSRLPQYQANYIFWKYAPACLPYEPKAGTFAELKANTPGFPDLTEREAESWLLEEDVQGAVKSLLERKNTADLLQLHEDYTMAAKTDPQALKALLELNKTLFKEQTNDLMKLLEGVPDNLDGEDDG